MFLTDLIILEELRNNSNIYQYFLYLFNALLKMYKSILTFDGHSNVEGSQKHNADQKNQRQRNQRSILYVSFYMDF